MTGYRLGEAKVEYSLRRLKWPHVQLVVNERVGAAHLGMVEERIGMTSLLRVEDRNIGFDDDHARVTMDFFVWLLPTSMLMCFAIPAKPGVISSFSES